MIFKYPGSGRMPFGAQQFCAVIGRRSRSIGRGMQMEEGDVLRVTHPEGPTFLWRCDSAGEAVRLER